MAANVDGAGRPPGGPARGGRYHHGALREALVASAEDVLAERGVEGFTLREAARRAGVSPAAPAHHFGDAAGLLTEVAILGFEGLAQALREGDARGGADPAARLREQGVGYVDFALSHPARFKLMFREERLRCDERFGQAAGAAFGILQDAIRAQHGLGPGEALTDAARAAALAAWSLVHGFAHLALDGQFDRMAGGQGRRVFVAAALPGVLAAMPGQGPAASTKPSP